VHWIGCCDYHGPAADDHKQLSPHDDHVYHHDNLDHHHHSPHDDHDHHSPAVA